MKKLFCLFLVIALLACGCSKEDKKTTEPTENPEETDLFEALDEGEESIEEDIDTSNVSETVEVIDEENDIADEDSDQLGSIDFRLRELGKVVALLQKFVCKLLQIVDTRHSNYSITAHVRCDSDGLRLAIRDNAHAHI